MLDPGDAESYEVFKEFFDPLIATRQLAGRVHSPLLGLKGSKRKRSTWIDF